MFRSRIAILLAALLVLSTLLASSVFAESLSRKVKIPKNRSIELYPLPERGDPMPVPLDPQPWDPGAIGGLDDDDDGDDDDLAGGRENRWGSNGLSSSFSPSPVGQSPWARASVTWSYLVNRLLNSFPF